MAIEMRPIGRTGLSVSTLGFGSAPLSGFRANVSERQGVETVLAAYARVCATSIPHRSTATAAAS